MGLSAGARDGALSRSELWLGARLWQAETGVWRVRVAEGAGQVWGEQEEQAGVVAGQQGRASG